jgi:hypothetical protein
MIEKTPPGELFSRVYLRRGAPASDSARMRRRLAAALNSIKDIDSEFGSLPPRKLGIDVPYNFGGYDWTEFFQKADMRDVLDTVTLAWQYLEEKKIRGTYDMNASGKWMREVRHILDEENVAYTINDLCAARYRIDEEYARSIAASIAALQDGRYANALHSFEAATDALSEIPPNGKQAIRLTFGAAEALFRMLDPTAPRLSGKPAESLRTLVAAGFKGQRTAALASEKMIDAFKDWVEACHFYRHEEGKADEIAQPPVELAVYLVSVGAAHLRWLAELDMQQPR